MHKLFSAQSTKSVKIHDSETKSPKSIKIHNSETPPKPIRNPLSATPKTQPPHTNTDYNNSKQSAEIS